MSGTGLPRAGRKEQRFSSVVHERYLAVALNPAMIPHIQSVASRGNVARRLHTQLR